MRFFFFLHLLNLFILLTYVYMEVNVFQYIYALFAWSVLTFYRLVVSLCTTRFKKKGEKLKWSRYRPSVAQSVGRGIALLFHDRGTRMEWVVSSMPWLHFTPRKDPVPILQEAGWAPGPVWTGRKSRPHRDLILDHPAFSQPPGSTFKKFCMMLTLFYVFVQI